VRHRLLRQSGGFERLGAVLVFFVSDDPLIADRVDDSARVLDPRIAALELASFMNHRDNPFISGIDELDQLQLVLPAEAAAGAGQFGELGIVPTRISLRS
jgi:hypothetical protein